MSHGLKFAVNARALRSPISGIGRYLRGVMREVERDGRFDPDYFCSTHWLRRLDEAPMRPAGSRLAHVRRVVRSLKPLVRRVERLNFASGLRRRKFAFYFEPNYLPFDTDLPTIITIHDLSHLRHPETHPVQRVRELKRELPSAIDRAACILTVSQFTRSEIVEIFGVDPGRVVVTPLGVDVRFFPRTADTTASLLSELDLTHGRYFLAVGTLEPRKNVLTTLHAHSRLPLHVRAAYPLVVAGMKGWLTATISRELELAQTRGFVRVLGHVDDDALPALYAGAVMLSYPSVYEGFGLPPLEAMASGIPVAVSNRASLPEVVGDAGIVLEPHDVDGLTSIMQRIIDDSEFAAGLIERGLERARSFTWERCASLTIQCWEKVLAAH